MTSKLKCDECGQYVGYTEGTDTAPFKTCPQRKDLRGDNCKFKIK